MYHSAGSGNSTRAHVKEFEHAMSFVLCIKFQSNQKGYFKGFSLCDKIKFSWFAIFAYNPVFPPFSSDILFNESRFKIDTASLFQNLLCLDLKSISNETVIFIIIIISFFIKISTLHHANTIRIYFFVEYVFVSVCLKVQCKSS